VKLDRETLIAGAAIAALLFWSRRASASPGADIVFTGDMQADPNLPQWATGYHDPVYDEGDAVEYQPIDSFYEAPPSEQVPVGVDWFAGAGSVQDILNRNVDALLDAIVWAENYPVDVVSGDAYRTFYGGAKFSDMSDHPVITREMQRVELPERYCRAAGYRGKCYSTAAGALQINVPTWLDFRNRGPYLPDFSRESQREIGRRILNSIGAIKELQNGDFAGAVSRASKRWASLPGSSAGQGGKSFAFVKQKFLDAGGTLA
jgi:muramidase (phage lysozyme)